MIPVDQRVWRTYLWVLPVVTLLMVLPACGVWWTLAALTVGYALAVIYILLRRRAWRLYWWRAFIRNLRVD